MSRCSSRFGRSRPIGSPSAVRPQPTTEGENRMAGFTYRLELEDGTPADPPTFDAAVPNWHPGDMIPLGRDRTLRVIDTRPGREPDEDPVLVVEAATGSG
jgi:hypothetical protein